MSKSSTDPLEGYTIAVFKQNNDKGVVIFEDDLKMNLVGGAHIVNSDALIVMIEDAIFVEEQIK